MFEYLKIFGFKDTFDSKENQDKVIDYVKKNYTSVRKGYEYSSLNYETKPISSIQLCLENRKNKQLLVYHSNNCLWKYRIFQHLEYLGDNYYLIGNNINNSYELNDEEYCIINIINKDILPSLNLKDIVWSQVSALATEISFFGNTMDENIKYGYTHNHLRSEPTLILSKLKDETKEYDKENVICGYIKSVSINHESLLEFSAITYCIEVDTKFGPLRIYFSEDQIKYMKGNIVAGTYFECKAIINGDTYLLKELSMFSPNFTNNLRLVSRAFASKNAKILKPYLAENCHLHSSNRNEIGKDNIINNLTQFFTTIKDKKITCSRVLLLNTLNQSFNDLVGKECLIYKEGNSRALLIYVRTNSDNKISEIKSEFIYNYSYTTSYSLDNIKNFKNKYEIDSLYKDVIICIITINKVSTSYIQRSFKIGYNRASKIIDSLEEAKIISECLENGKRKILIKDISKAIKIYEIKYKDN